MSCTQVSLSTFTDSYSISEIAQTLTSMGNDFGTHALFVASDFGSDDNQTRASCTFAIFSGTWAKQTFDQAFEAIKRMLPFVNPITVAVGTNGL